MSYCRWSTDKFQSDVYAYADMMDEYTIHVRKYHPISVEHVPDYNVMEWLEKGHDCVEQKHKEYMDAVKKIEYEPIGLPYDGETIGAEDLKELYRWLGVLRSVGYYVPDSALELVFEEMMEEE